MQARAIQHDCEYRRRVAELETELARLRQAEKRVGELEEHASKQAAQLAALQRHVFGRKSEKLPPVEPQLRPKREANDAQAQQIRADNRAKQLELAAQTTLYKVDDERRVCPSCEDSKLKRIGGGRKTTSFEYVPGFIVRDEHVQEVLSCTRCDYVVRADAPTRIFERARYGAGLMAHIVTQKCCDSVPIHRLEKQFRRLGVPVSRSTLTDLFHRMAQELSPLSRRLHEKVAQADIVQADETPLKVQKRKQRAYAWVFLSKDRETAANLVAFCFSPNRSGQTPLRVLGGTTGTLVVDAYTGYNSVTDVDGRQRAGCMAHLRRKFFEAQSSAPKAAEALEIILEAYRVEHEAREQNIVGTKQHLELRKSRSHDAMERLRQWMTRQRDQHPPKSVMGKAITYAENNWDALTRFVSDAKIPIDNNASERALRRVALGRKNFLFVGHDEAGRNLAGLYSLVATCEANGVNPQAYLRDVMMRVGEHPASKVDELLPHLWVEKYQDVTIDELENQSRQQSY